MKKILLIDGFGFIFKSYYAFINRPLTNSKGENTSAIFGFYKTLISILNKEKPDYYLVALEGKGECFRNKIYPEYKANRSPAPEDLKPQIVKIIDLLGKLDIPHVSIDGYEADDVIGTISEKLVKEGNKEAIIYSSDKDLRQLVTDRVYLCHPGRMTDEYKMFNSKKIIEEMGIAPEQVIDYLALAGDSSDNIPGVNGIGPKTAINLLKEMNSLENIYSNLNKIFNKKLKEKLIEYKENAFLSQKLAKINTGMDIILNWDEWENKSLNIDKAKPYLEDDNLKTVIQAIEDYNRNNFGNTSLFDKNKILDKDKDVQNKEIIFKEKELSKLTKEYKIILKKEDLLKKIKTIQKKGHICFDLETTGFDFLSNKIISFSFAIDEEDVFIVPLNISLDQQNELDIKIDDEYINDIIDTLKLIFEDEKILKIGHNLKFDIKFLKSIDIVTNGEFFDTMLAEYCIDSSRNILNMDDLAYKYLSYKTIHYKDVVADPKKDTLQDVPIKKLIDYSGEDADITFQLYKILNKKINNDNKLKTLFYNIEMPMLKVLIDMEYYGVSIDNIYLNNLSKQLEKELADITERLMDMAGEEFNPNSPKQVGEILFNKLKLPVIKKTKTGASTDVDVLKKLSYIHPLASLLLEYRTLSKIKSTYSDSLPLMVNPVSGKIHTTYLQTGTQTGRLSSKDPNLQNIPVKTELGRKIRVAFIPSKGNILASADYSQIELFLLAEFTKDPNLFDAFKNKEDVHAKTASLIFDKKTGDVTKDERSIGKTINFSILYGQGALRLSENLEISRKEAANFISIYFTKYAGVKKYMEEIKDKCRQTGYVETYWGRKRSILEIFDKNKMRQANGERIAVNTIFQGSAADLIKISMNRIYKRFKEENIKSKLIMQVHDELIFDIVPAEKDRVLEIIKDSMENGFNFNLQLQTSIKTGKNWGELY